MGKTYYGLIEKNPENPKETVNVVRVNVTGERGRVVKRYHLEPADEALDIPFNGYAWDYSGAGPKTLAEAILFDYTSDVEKTRKYRDALIYCEIRHFDNHKGFILGDHHIEAAMRFGDREQEELGREEKRRERLYQFCSWRHDPMRAMGALGRWAKDAYSEDEYLTWFIGVVVGLLGIIFALD